MINSTQGDSNKHRYPALKFTVVSFSFAASSLIMFLKADIESQITKVVLSCLTGPLVIAACLWLYCSHKLGSNNVFLFMYRLLQVVIIVAGFKMANHTFILQQLVFIYPLVFVERLTLSFHIIRLIVMIICMIAVFSDDSVYVVLIISNLDAILEICHCIYEWQVQKIIKKREQTVTVSKLFTTSMKKPDRSMDKGKVYESNGESRKNLLISMQSHQGTAIQPTSRITFEDNAVNQNNLKKVEELPIEEESSVRHKEVISSKIINPSNAVEITPCKPAHHKTRLAHSIKAPSTGEAHSPRSNTCLIKGTLISSFR